MRKFILGIFLLSVISFVAGCKKKAPTPKPTAIKIGVVGPFTGPLSVDAYSILEGVKLAVDEVNAKGGINNMKVEIVTGDDMANPARAVKVADSLASDRNVLAIIGHYNSSCTIAASYVYNRHGVVAISPASTSPRITEAGKYIFRVCPSDAQQGKELGRFATKTLGKRRIAIIYDNDDYGKGLKYCFSMEAKRAGADIVAEIPYGEDIADRVRRLVGLKPDLIFVACVMSSAAKVCRALHELPLEATILGGDGMISDEFRRRAGVACEGVIHTVFFHPDLPGAREFVRKYESKYGHAPGGWAALAYDATNAVLKAMKEVGINREAIRNYLASLGTTRPPLHGVSGDIAFDAFGDIVREILFAQVRNGNPEIIKVK